MTYNVLFLDIDGTILKPDHTYTEATKNAIDQVKNKGIEVFLATGRPAHELTELANQLEIDSIIGYNGAYARYRNKTIINEPINNDIIKQYVEISKLNNHEIVFYTSEKNYFTSLDSPIVNKFIDTFQLKYNDLYTEDISGEVLGITLMNLDPTESDLYKLDDNIHLAQVNLKGLGHCYDVIRSNVNKGTAVQQLFEVLNITKKQAIAFGDGMNDKEMFLAVEESFAMENAHADLFAYAKHTTTSVSNSGIFDGLEQLGLVK